MLTNRPLWRYWEPDAEWRDPEPTIVIGVDVADAVRNLAAVADALAAQMRTAIEALMLNGPVPVVLEPADQAEHGPARRPFRALPIPLILTKAGRVLMLHIARGLEAAGARGPPQLNPSNAWTGEGPADAGVHAGPSSCAPSKRPPMVGTYSAKLWGWIGRGDQLPRHRWPP
jgi:hypothetical protein